MSQTTWHYQQQTLGNAETVGPISNAQMLDHLRTGVVKAKDMVSSPTATKGQWYPAGKVPVIQKMMAMIREEAKQRKQETVNGKKQAAAVEQKVKESRRAAQKAEFEENASQFFLCRVRKRRSTTIRRSLSPHAIYSLSGSDLLG